MNNQEYSKDSTAPRMPNVKPYFSIHCLDEFFKAGKRNIPYAGEEQS
jgi:hypothetical protein